MSQHRVKHDYQCINFVSFITFYYYKLYGRQLHHQHMYPWWNEMSQRHHQQVWRGKTNILIHISCTSHKNVEEHVPDIMNNIIDTEAKLWHKKHGSIKNFFYMLDLKIEEYKIYGMC